MKVNVIGKGVIPGVGLLAPKYGIDLSKEQVSRIINFKSFNVVGCDGIGLITRNNVNKVFEKETAIENDVKPAKAKVEKLAQDIKQETVETPVVDVVEETVVEEPVVVEEKVEEEVIEDIVEVSDEEIAQIREIVSDPEKFRDVVEETTVEEPVETTQTQQQNNYKKKKKRH